MTVLASPVAVWRDQLGPAAGAPLARLVPQKTAAGYWVVLPVTSAPSPNTLGAIIDDGAGYLKSVTSTVSGKRLTRNAAGFVFTY